ncbi:MAG TPA: hypothetical protein VH475_15245 [Tepidisphaeraceae bacterium]
MILRAGPVAEKVPPRSGDDVASCAGWAGVRAVKTISCAAGYGCGELGRRFAQFMETTRSAGALKRYFSPVVRAGDQGVGHVIRARAASWPRLQWELWDRKIAGMLEPGMECFVGFAGMALQSFRAARRMGCLRLELVMGDWVMCRRRVMGECGLADGIWVEAGSTRDLLVRAGVDETKVRSIPAA